MNSMRGSHLTRADSRLLDEQIMGNNNQAEQQMDAMN